MRWTRFRQNNLHLPDWVLGLLLCLLTVLVYLPSFQAGFIWDDDQFLTNNPLIHAADGLRRFWFGSEAPDYFPLTSSLLWLEWRVWGLHPAGYHAVNIILHACSVLLLWLVLKTLRVPAAWVCALAWGVHPVNVESVSWITEGKNTLPMPFYLLTVLSWLRWRETRRPRWYALALAAFALALLGKPYGAALPLILLILVWWREGRVTRNELWASLPLFALSLILSAVTVHFQYHNEIAGEAVRVLGPVQRIASAGLAVWFYFGKALLPLHLCFVYPHWRTDLSSLKALLPGGSLALIMVGLFWLRKSLPRGSLAALLCYLLALLPCLGFFNIYFMRYSDVADHWQYLALIVPVVVIGTLEAWALERSSWSRLMWPLAVLWVVWLAGLTWQQQGIYQNREALWRATLREDSQSGIALNNLAVVEMQQGNLAEAKALLIKVTGLYLDSVVSWRNLGLVQSGLGDETAAVEAYQTGLAMAERELATAPSAKNATGAARLRHELALLHSALGASQRRQGKSQLALRNTARAVEEEPAAADLRNDYGLALAQAGRVNEAMEQFRAAARLAPRWFSPANNLAWYLVTTSFVSANRAEGLREAETAAKLSGYHNSQVLDTLAVAQAANGDFTAAVATAQQAVDLTPEGAGKQKAAALERVRLLRNPLKFRKLLADHTL